MRWKGPVGSIPKRDKWAKALECLELIMPSLYVHLSLDERRRLFRLREAKMPIAEIAAALGRHRSTVHREIARNWWHDAQMPQAEGYWPLTAQDLAVRRRHAGAKLERHAELAAAVIDRLRAGWSPEQIAGRLRVEPAAPHRLCHETIYRFVYGPTGQSEELARHLPRRRRRRRPRFARKPRSPVFPDRVAIRHRPATVKDHAEFGHWGEAGPWPLWGRVSPPNDLMMFRREHGAANVATVVERTTRYTVVFRNSDRRSKPIMGRLIDALAPLPAEARRSITFDRGLEFVSWRELDAGLGAKAWFCDPQAPWQKGTVENTNGRLRRHLPRDTDVLSLPNRALASIRDRLNATPRKCLGFRTPAEAFQDAIMEPHPPS